MAQRPQGGTSSARNGKRESFLFSGSQENRRAHPPLFFPDHRQRATSCISWRRITPGQHRQQAAAILRQMRTEAAFLRGAAFPRTGCQRQHSGAHRQQGGHILRLYPDHGSGLPAAHRAGTAGGGYHRQHRPRRGGTSSARGRKRGRERGGKGTVNRGGRLCGVQ